MEFGEQGVNIKPKRVRKAPYRKWSEQEQRQLLNFLRENQPMEKTTAQVFYKRFLEAHNLQLDWSLVRLKVRHLRKCYNKARSWQNSTGAGAMQNGETTKSVLSKMCPFYDELEEIFGYREFASNDSVLDTEDNSTLDSSTLNAVLLDTVLLDTVVLDANSTSEVIVNSVEESGPISPEVTCSSTRTGRKGNLFKNCSCGST